MIFSVSIKSSQGEFIKSFNLSPFLPTKASHSHFESKPLQLGKPLAVIPEVQRLELDKLINESLHKTTLLGKVREFFKLKLVSNHI